MEPTAERWSQLSPLEAVFVLFDNPSEEAAHARLKSLGPELDQLTDLRRSELLTLGTGNTSKIEGWLWIATELCARPPQARPAANWSRWIDRVLDALAGIDYSASEARVPRSHGSERAEAVQSAMGMASWSGSGRLSQSSLNTPYAELFRQFESLALEPTHVVVDLGCAYGRLGYVTASLLSEGRFFGYEIVPPRLDACKKAARFLEVSTRIRFEQADLASPEFEVPSADLYYLYDPVNEDTLTKLMSSLYRISRAGRAFRILARGRTGSLHSVLEKTKWLKLESKPHQGEMPWGVYLVNR